MPNPADAPDFNAAKEELVANLRRVIADAEDLLTATAGETGDKIDDLRARARDNLALAREKLADAEATLRVNARRAASAADDYVRENPWSSLGAAAAVGMVLGVLLSRR